MADLPLGDPPDADGSTPRRSFWKSALAEVVRTCNRLDIKEKKNRHGPFFLSGFSTHRKKAPEKKPLDGLLMFR